METDTKEDTDSDNLESPFVIPAEEEPLMQSDCQSTPPSANEHSQTTICGIACDPDLVKYKAFLFLFYGGFGSIFPYLGLYFKQIGLNAKYVGMLVGVRPLTQFVSGPFWAALADRYRCRKGILLFSILAWLVMTFLLAVPRPQNEFCKVTNASSSVVGRNVENSNKIDVGSSVLVYEIQRDPGELWKIFIILLILIITGEFLEVPSFILTDTAVLEHLGENKKYYGKTRLFGSLGYGLASFCVGGILDLWKFEYCGKIYTNYIGLFYLFSGFMIVGFFFGWFAINFKYVDSEKKASFNEVLRMLANLKYGTFLVMSLTMGFFHGCIISFLNWYLEDLGASKLMMGIAMAFRSVCIISGFFASGHVIKTYGQLTIIYFTFAGNVVSFFAYSAIPSPWWAIPIECVQGLTYSMSWSAFITYLGDASPPNAKATVQGIIQGVYWGLGTGLGAIAGGAVINRIGIIKSFRVGGAVSAVIFFIFLAIQLIIARRERKEAKIHWVELMVEDK